MPGHPMQVENTNLGCHYNTDSVSQLLISTNSFSGNGKEETLQSKLSLEKSEGFITSNINYVLSSTHYRQGSLNLVL